ncbi:unnamed protein product, partial [Polarella glacialis]
MVDGLRWATNVSLQSESPSLVAGVDQTGSIMPASAAAAETGAHSVQNLPDPKSPELDADASSDLAQDDGNQSKRRRLEEEETPEAAAVADATLEAPQDAGALPGPGCGSSAEEQRQCLPPMVNVFEAGGSISDVSDDEDDKEWMMLAAQPKQWLDLELLGQLVRAAEPALHQV